MSGSGNLNSKDKDANTNSVKNSLIEEQDYCVKANPSSYSSGTSPSDRKTGSEWDRERILCTEVPEWEELQEQKWGDSIPE